MAQSASLGDKEICEIVSSELDRFVRLIRGHERLLAAIGGL